MANFQFQPREIPLNENYDVIVVGGGPSGCAAAISASREGAKTLLIEATGVLGGLGTSGLVPAWCPFSDKEKIIYRGLAEKVFFASKEGVAHAKPEDWDWVPIDHERLKRVYDRMVSEAGVDILFYSFLTAVEASEGEVSTLIVSNKKGLSAYKAKVYVDCSGDGDLSVWAGAQYEKGNAGGELMPSTLCFTLSSVNDYYYKNKVRLHEANKQSPIYKIRDDEKYPLVKDTHCCNSTVGPGTVGFNAGHVFDVDNTDPENVSQAIITGRELAYQLHQALTEYVPEAFAGSFLVNTAPMMGVRESRRIIGDYVLTLEDYAERKTFPDEICRNNYFIDIHQSLKEREAEKSGNFDWEQRCARYGPGESHGIPYRCLTPKGLKNVLIAGRSVSCEQAVQGSVRVMPVCLVMGEAAGMAAVHAYKNAGSDVHKVDVGFLRKRLLEEGAFFL